MAELPNRSAYETEIANRLQKLSAKHRAEIIAYLGNPPSYYNVPQEFWDKVEEEERDTLLPLLLLVFVASAELHGARFGLSREATLSEAQTWAETRASEVAAGYAQHSREMVERASERWGVAIAGADGAEAVQAGFDVSDDLQSVFGASRNERIAITETTFGQTAGGEFGIAETVGLSEDDTWFTTEGPNVCPVCRPLHNTPRSEWSAFFPLGTPAHTDCQCWIQYAVEKAALTVQ